jgi:indole-3-pyruvate monooxygenase
MKTGTNTIIIGASAAGLACARCLEEKGLFPIILEQQPDVAAPWRNHYQRLHLHTPKHNSSLPYFPMPDSYPKYPSRQQVVDYLVDYAKTLKTQPLFYQKVNAVVHNGTNWLVSTSDKKYTADQVIIATGNTRKPVWPKFEGVENFCGSVIHSSSYINGAPYEGKKVLIVGFGNSACEIAICLHEHGAFPYMSVRNGINVIPRDIFGIPIVYVGLVESFLPPTLADSLNKPFIRLALGNIDKSGLKQLPYGAITQIEKDHKAPVIDVGTLKLIRDRAIKILPGISRFTETGVVLDDGREEQFDAVILGTGYSPALNDFLKDTDSVLDRNGCPKISGGQSTSKGLYFCGFEVVATGALHEIGIEAKAIAKDIANKCGKTVSG